MTAKTTAPGVVRDQFRPGEPLVVLADLSGAETMMGAAHSE
jgi:hypothetical protein